MSAGRMYDVAVVGGGVIGCSCAYYLARAGARVALVESRFIAAGASGACDGCVFMQTKRPGPHLDFARVSRARFDSLGRELGFDIEFEPCGGIVLADGADDEEGIRRFVEAGRSSGFGVDFLNAGALRRRTPCIASDAHCASYCADDARVDPLALTHGFLRAAQRLGACTMLGTRVQRIVVRGGLVQGVQAECGTVRAASVVLAAGAWSPVLARTAGIELPIRPRRGQILVTEPVPRILPHVMVNLGYLGTKFGSRGPGSAGIAFSAEQTAAGAVLLGGTREFVGFDVRTTYTAIRRIAAYARRWFPLLGEAAVIRSFAGLRPHTPDGMPIIDSLERPTGLFLACGHEGDGIALAPATGSLIAEMVARGEPASRWAAFRLARFDAGHC